MAEGQPLRQHRPLAPQLDPWLVYIHGKRGRKQTFFSISEGRRHVKNIPQMRGKDICASSHGWLVLLDNYSDGCTLLNPISMEEIQLPPLLDFIYHACVLSSPPNDSKCIVLFIGGEQGVGNFVYCKPGDTCWAKQNLKLEKAVLITPKHEDTITTEHEDAIVSAACYDGEIYMVTLSGKLLGVQVDPSITLTYLEVKQLKLSTSTGYPIDAEPFLIESCSKLFGVYKIFYGEVIDFEIFQLDFGQKVWMSVESLGDYAFFIGSIGRIVSCSAKESGIKGNTIYFTQPDDRSLYAFDLEEKSVAVCLPCPNVKSDWSQPEWVLPLVRNT